MPEVCRSGLLLECEAFGVPAGFHAFVLSPEAQAVFDNIIAAHVRRIGGLQAKHNPIKETHPRCLSPLT
jgi:hypothetical protein